jgi:hypothetical protein
MFDKEKIVSSVKISMNQNDVTGIPVFAMAASRNCNFGPNDRLEYNGKTKVRSSLSNNHWKAKIVSFIPCKYINVSLYYFDIIIISMSICVSNFVH